MENKKTKKTSFSSDIDNKQDDVISGLKERIVELEKQLSYLNKAESEHLENEENYKDIYDTISDGITYTTLSGKVLSVNKNLEKILGIPKEELIGKSILSLAKDLLTPGSLKLVGPLLKSIITGKEIEPFQVDYKDKTLEVTANINLKTKRLTGTIRDITETKRTENALRVSEARLRRAELASKSGNWELHLGNGTMIGSEGAMKLYGVNNFATNYSIIKEIPLPEYRQMMDEALNGLIKQNKPYNIEFKIRNHLTGEIIDIHSICEYDTENQILFGSIQDITEKNIILENLIGAKEKAEESDRLKTAFLHNISHEIRTPLNAIIGFSGFLEQTDLTPEDRKSYIDIIFQSNNQLLSIINDILNISHIETGQVVIRETKTNLNLIIKNLYNQFQTEAEKKNLTIRLFAEASDSEAMILTDESKLIQILSNLLNNAIKFTEKGSIEMGYKIEGESLEFFVKDTGIGIPVCEQSRIFERFYQVDKSISRLYSGTGLGLSISNAFAELLGGRFKLVSEPGKGSTFFFTIPYKKAGQIPEAESRFVQKSKPEMNMKKTILIAEDEESNYALIQAMLKAYDYNLIRAVNGQDAINQCMVNAEISLVLMDIKMPLKDGFEATSEILKFRPGIPIIAQTAYAHPSDRNRALECGCVDYISKPFEKKQLLSLIEKYVS